MTTPRRFLPTGPARAALALALLLAVAPAGAQEVTRSPHGETRLALACGDCHTATAWAETREPMRFDHARQTAFALTGRHATVDCTTCHADARFDRPRASVEQCASCHVDPHEGTLSLECAECHTTTSFADARAPELHLRTSFALEGAHAVIECERCHTSGLAAPIPPLETQCIGCHASDRARARFPDHLDAAFPQECVECHPPTTWLAARFDHAELSGFDLLGAHASISCAACHVPPANTIRWPAADENDCVACHQADADRAHPGAFQSTCIDCHNVRTWAGATFEHDGFFPIFSGEHRGEWDTCRDCHTTGDFSAFTCATCHSRPEMDDAHDDEPGYAFEPQRCLACHPRGDKEDD